MSATQKIAVHSLAGNTRLHPNISHPTNSSSDLKNTTDDALPNYLHSLKFKQIHTQTDVRLALGYSAVVIAGVLFYFDWKLGWEATKPYTAPAVVAYFLLNGAFSYWLWFVEKGVVYEGEGKTGKVRSSSPSAACRLHKTADRLTLEYLDPHLLIDQEAHPRLRMRRRLQTGSLRVQPRAEAPHPPGHDTMVYNRWLLHREAVPAVACVRDPGHWCRRP